jgi:4-amino-4-deoxy-L-arabinose transferase-like glycosyltransferase
LRTQTKVSAREPGDYRADATLALSAAVLVFVVLFWQLGGPTFWDPDEAHYAETTREMIATGDWWVPHYNGQVFFDKPMLFHQLQGIAMLAVGQNELGARLVPALAALGLIAITVWFAAAMTARPGAGVPGMNIPGAGAPGMNIDVGIVAGLMLASSAGVFALARYAILDSLFTMFTFGGAAALTVAALTDRRRLQWIGYVAIALGVLTKGPIAFVLCGLTLLLAIAVSADARRRLLALHWIAGLTLVVAIAAPWFIYMYWRFGRAFVDGYLLDENIRLFASSRFAGQPGVWFYFQILATGLLPWTALIVGRLIDDVRAVWRGERLDTLEVLLWAWTGAVVGFFSLSTFKLDHYVFPAAPALCVLCARAWVDLRTAGDRSRHEAASVGLHLAGPLMVAVGLGFGYLLIVRLDLPSTALLIPAALTICGAGMTVLLNLRGGRPARVPWFVIAASIFTYGGLIVFVLPALEQRKVVDDVALWVSARAQPDDRVASFRLNRWNPTFRFYVDRPTTFLEDAGEAATFFSAPGRFYCVMRRSAYDEFAAKGIPLNIVHERDGIWATSGQALWRRREAPVQFVIVSGPQ